LGRSGIWQRLLGDGRGINRVGGIAGIDMKEKIKKWKYFELENKKRLARGYKNG